MAKLHPIAKELSTVYGIKPGSLSDKALAKKLHDAATDEGPEADEKWESLTDEAQAWVNAGTDAMENDEALPGWDAAAEKEAPKAKGKAKAKDADEDDEDEEDAKPAKKGAKASKAKDEDEEGEAEEDEKPAKKGAKAAKSKAKDEEEEEEEEDEDEKPAKKGSAKSSKSKPAPKAEKKPAKKKAASADRDEGAITGQWIKIFTAVQKKGAKGIARADLDALCEKYDRKPHYGRFIRAGILEYVERGVLKLSKTGEKALASAE